MTEKELAGFTPETQEYLRKVGIKRSSLAKSVPAKTEAGRAIDCGCQTV